MSTLYLKRKLLNFAVLVAGAALFFSCREKMEFIDTTLRDDLPVQEVYNFTTTYSDSALLKLRMEAPLMKYYGRMEKPYSEFEKGIDVLFYDEVRADGQPSARITSKFARYYEAEKLWEVRDSVVVINRKGEILETELLYWDENKELIYTDKFVKIKEADHIIMGTGLESDIHMNTWIIKNISGEISLKNE